MGGCWRGSADRTLFAGLGLRTLALPRLGVLYPHLAISVPALAWNTRITALSLTALADIIVYIRVPTVFLDVSLVVFQVQKYLISIGAPISSSATGETVSTTPPLV